MGRAVIQTLICSSTSFAQWDWKGRWHPGLRLLQRAGHTWLDHAEVSSKTRKGEKDLSWSMRTKPLGRELEKSWPGWMCSPSYPPGTGQRFSSAFIGHHSCAWEEGKGMELIFS